MARLLFNNSLSPLSFHLTLLPLLIAERTFIKQLLENKPCLPSLPGATFFFEATFSPIIRKGYLTRSGKRSTLFHQWLYTLVKLGVQLVDGASLERVALGTFHRN